MHCSYFKCHQFNPGVLACNTRVFVKRSVFRGEGEKKWLGLLVRCVACMRSTTPKGASRWLEKVPTVFSCTVYVFLMIESHFFFFFFSSLLFSLKNIHVCS